MNTNNTTSEYVNQQEANLTMQRLSVIPISELQYHVPSSEYRTAINRLKAKGIATMSQLASFEAEGYTNLASVRIALKWKTFVVENSKKIISEWEDYNSTKTIPSSYDSSLGIVQNFKNALIEYAEIIKSRLSDKRYFKSSISPEAKSACLLANILLLAYRDGYNDDEIRKNPSLGKVYTYERIQEIRSKCVECILIKGKTRFNNIRFHQDLIKIKGECMFKSLRILENRYGLKDVNILSLLGFDLINVCDESIVIPPYAKGIYSRVAAVTTDVLLESLLPEDKDSIVQYILDSPKLEDENFNPAFVANILDNPSIIDEFEDGRIQIKDKFLTNDSQRFARIIYNAQEKITADEAKKRYEEEYGSTPAAGPSTDERYGICCQSKKYWYYGEPLTPIKDAIADYAEKNKIFYYSELENHLKSCGYYIQKSIRTIITNICRVDNKDINHFCHKDYTNSYSSYSWRNPTIYGQTNWMLKETKAILGEQTSMNFDMLMSALADRASGTEYEKAVKKNGRYAISSFCGEGLPFVSANNLIIKNEPYFSETEFATIGLKEGKYPFYSQIRSIAFNEVKRSENGRVSLNDIINVIHDTISEELSRGVVIRAIEDKDNRFAPIDIKLISEDGNRFVVWTGNQIQAEPTYEITASEKEEDVELVNERRDVVTKPGIKYRQIVDWNELNQAMKHELSFYKNWMLREEYDLSNSIDKFLDFLSHAENKNLNNKLPQCLYEYWFASTDSYDRSTYLTNLALFFEALLAEIYYQTKGVKPNKGGLSSWAEEFEGLSTKIKYNRESKGFDRIARDLHYKRNRIAHGEDIELSSLETAKTITDFVALYVYIIARYYNK